METSHQALVVQVSLYLLVLLTLTGSGVETRVIGSFPTLEACATFKMKLEGGVGTGMLLPKQRLDCYQLMGTV